MIEQLLAMSLYAIYAVALQPNYALFPFQEDQSKFAERVKGKLLLKDLDLLAPNPLCQLQMVLYSAALARGNAHLDCIVKRRDRSKTIVLGDSGGFSIISGALQNIDNDLRLKTLLWLEKFCDVGFNLDVPLACLDYPGKSGFSDFDQCLDATLAGIRYFIDHRSSSEFKLLNILQGTTQENADRWYLAVREYQKYFEGIAFAGVMKADFHYVCSRILQMIDRGELHSKSWIHFLGVGTPSVAVILTSLKRALREIGLTSVEITFDTCSPFLNAGKFTKATSGLKFSDTTFTTLHHKLPINAEECERSAPFPFNSPIGRRLNMGDFMHKTIVGESAWDQTGSALLANHNIYAETSSIIQANKLVDMGYRVDALVPCNVRQVAEVVWEIITSNRPDYWLKEYEVSLRQFSNAKQKLLPTYDYNDEDIVR